MTESTTLGVTPQMVMEDRIPMTSDQLEERLRATELLARDATRSLHPDAARINAEYEAMRMSYHHTQQEELQKRVAAAQDSYSGPPLRSGPTGLGDYEMLRPHRGPVRRARPNWDWDWEGYATPSKTGAQLAEEREKRKAEDEEKRWSDAKMDAQKFLMKMGIMSNANVVIQEKDAFASRYGTGFNSNLKSHRMKCEECNATAPLDSSVVNQRILDDGALIEFCRTHRHDGSEVVSMLDDAQNGRVFKEI